MRSYETDYYGWAEDTARAICNGDFTEIDRAALADEVAALGRQERQRMTSRLTVLLHHLLKLKYQPTKASRSWELTVWEQRKEAVDLLGDSPSLRPLLPELMSRAYYKARIRTAKETGLDVEMLPEGNPFTDSEIWGERTPEY